MEDSHDNKILKLLDEQFVKQLFDKEVLPKYPEFQAIKEIKIRAVKKHIWIHTYHVVFRYDMVCLTKENETKPLPIFCSAHSSEPRKNVFDVLEFLWERNFGHDQFTIPHPLFYSQEFNATFYRGVEGNNLYHYIREKDFAAIEDIIPRAAAWLCKLHSLSTDDGREFNRENSRIATVLPGREMIVEDIKQRHPEYLEIFKKLYEKFVSIEDAFFASTDRRWYIHGDAHPENVIRMSATKLAVIDFTDVSLGDFARDLGTFLQQLEYMSMRKIGNPIYTAKIKQLFLSSYLECSGCKFDESLQQRIDNYYNWTAIRTATYFLLKHDPQPDRAKPLVDEVCARLGIKR